MTGDAAINAVRPGGVCNRGDRRKHGAAQWGRTEIGQVVMDEFHFYGDPNAVGPGRTRCSRFSRSSC